MPAQYLIFLSQIDNEMFFTAGVTGGAGSSGRCRTNSWGWTEDEKNINQIFFFNELACTNCLWVHLASQWKSWAENFKKETSCTEVRFTACPTAIFVAQLRGEGAVIWNGSHDWGWEQGGRRKGFSRPSLCQGHHKTSPWFIPPPPVSGAQEQHRALYLGQSSQHKPQHHEACSQLHLGSTAPSARCPPAPEQPLSFPQWSFEEMTDCFPSQGCHLPNAHVGSSETNFDSSKPNP